MALSMFLRVRCIFLKTTVQLSISVNLTLLQYHHSHFNFVTSLKKMFFIAFFFFFTFSTGSSLGFSGGSAVKNPPANAGNMSPIPGSGRSAGEGNGNPLQHSCLGNPMNRGAWWAIVHGVAGSWTRLSDKNNNNRI